MNRRTLLTRALAGALAVAVVPKVGTADAAPEPQTVSVYLPWQDWGEPNPQSVRVYREEDVRQARAEGYERGRAVEQARAESRAPRRQGVGIDVSGVGGWEHGAIYYCPYREVGGELER